MTLRYYFDEHIPRAITIGLRLRGVDILTAQEDLAGRRADSDLLDRAAVLGRIVFTHDTDFLRIAAERITSATPFAGVVFAYPLDVTIGRLIADLELLAKAAEPPELANRVEFLPL